VGRRELLRKGEKIGTPANGYGLRLKVEIVCNSVSILKTILLCSHEEERNVIIRW
jgi:hypothetical protein